MEDHPNVDLFNSEFAFTPLPLAIHDPQRFQEIVRLQENRAVPPINELYRDEAAGLSMNLSTAKQLMRTHLDDWYNTVERDAYATFYGSIPTSPSPLNPFLKQDILGPEVVREAMETVEYLYENNPPNEDMVKQMKFYPSRQFVDDYYSELLGESLQITLQTMGLENTHDIIYYYLVDSQ